jgi:hypothetical protein
MRLLVLLWLILQGVIFRPSRWAFGPRWGGVWLCVGRVLLVGCLGVVVLGSVRLGEGVDCCNLRVRCVGRCELWLQVYTARGCNWPQ